MNPRSVRVLGVLAGATVLACVGNLEHEPGAYFGGVSVTGGVGGRAAVLDAGTRSPAPDDRRPSPAAWPDAAAMGEPDAGSAPWDAPPAEPDAMAQVMPPPMPDVAPPSACAPGTDGVALLAMRCGGCHNPMNAAKGLDLRTAGLGMRTVGKASTCQGRPLLVAGPGAPAGHLLDKIEGPVPGCGNQMPFGGPALSAQEKACVREWAAQAIAKLRGMEVLP
jgi:hypothetical protein